MYSEEEHGLNNTPIKLIDPKKSFKLLFIYNDYIAIYSNYYPVGN